MDLSINGGMAVNEQRKIKVGEWTATPALNLLERDGHARKIEPRAMDVLVYFAEHAGEVVSAEDLLKAVWQGRTVGDGAVYQSINQLRHALGDGANGERYIQTIPKRGYQLVMPTRIMASEARNETEVTRGRSGPMVLIGFTGAFLLALAIVASRYLPQDEEIVGSTTASLDVRPVRRSRLIVGSAELISGLSAHIALSPDGTQLVYAAQLANSRRRLYHRPLDGLEARPMPGTEGAEQPFFSPDGQWVAFYTDETDAQLKRVSLSGGRPQVLADALFSTGGSWVSDDEIVYGTGDPGHGRALFRLPASGGQPQTLATPTPDSGHVRPEVLPNGKGVLFVIRPGVGGDRPARDGAIAVLSSDTGEIRELIRGGYAPRYAPTGHIIFARAGALWAVPFDIDRREKTGPEVAVIEGVQQESVAGAASYAFSRDGLLVYVPGDDTATSERSNRTLVWVDREGFEEEINVPPQPYRLPRLSPDGQQAAFTIAEGGRADIWIYDLLRNTWRQLTFELAQDAGPLWTPDGERVFFRSTRDGNDIYWIAADGTGQPQRVLTGSREVWPESFSSDGKWLVFRERTDNGVDLFLMSMEGAQASHPFITDEGRQDGATFSPDGHWLAYRSNETGRFEIYVRPVNEAMEPGRKRRISTDGGDEPIWGAEGNELFFRSGNAVMAVRIDANGSVVSWDSPRLLFNGDYILPQDSTIPPFVPEVPNYAFSADRDRFLMLKVAAGADATAAAQQTSMVVVENWFEELNRLAPPPP